jgi:hypothetical protein
MIFAVEASHTQVTFTVNATTDKLFATAHGYANGMCVQLSTTGTLPTGFSSGRDYFVIVADSDHFYLADTATDSLNFIHKDFTDTGSGTHSANPTMSPNGVLEKQAYIAQRMFDYGADTVIFDNLTPRTDLDDVLAGANAKFASARTTLNSSFDANSWPTGTRKIHFGTDIRVQDTTDLGWYIDKVHGTLAFYTAKATTAFTDIRSYLGI